MKSKRLNHTFVVGLFAISFRCMDSDPMFPDRMFLRRMPSAFAVDWLETQHGGYSLRLNGGCEEGVNINTLKIIKDPRFFTACNESSLLTSNNEQFGEEFANDATNLSFSADAPNSIPFSSEEVPTVLQSGCVVIAGGRGNASFSPIQAAACWNAASVTWSALPPLRHCRRSGEIALLDGCLYICGGAPQPRPQPHRKPAKWT